MIEYEHIKTTIDGQQLFWINLPVHARQLGLSNKAVLGELLQAADEIRHAGVCGVILQASQPTPSNAQSNTQQLQTLASRSEALRFFRLGQAVCQAFENLPVTTLALLEGSWLGHYFELALAMDYRLAADSPLTQLGFQDIQLGLHPAFGGTGRSIARAGITDTLDMILSGTVLNAQQALQKHLVDACVPVEQLQTTALEFIQLRPPSAKAPASAQLLNNAAARLFIGRQLRSQLEQKQIIEEQYPAPYALVNNWQKQGSEAPGLQQVEAESAASLLQGDTAQNLLKLQLQRERIQAFGDHSDFRPTQVHVLGAGVMGRDIAACCVTRGLHVSLQDTNPIRLEAALTQVLDHLDSHYSDPDSLEAAKSRIVADAKGKQIGQADVIIESIHDQLSAKQEVLAYVEELARPDALLATTTSCIALDRLAAVLLKPQRLVGMHFFNPTLQLKLVEVGQTIDLTDYAEVGRACAFLLRLGKLPLPTQSNKGYAINRILFPYILQGIRLHQQNVPHTVLDKAGRDFGITLGPLEMADLFGLDYCRSVSEALAKVTQIKIPELLVEMVNSGKLGRKNGSGFYRYRNGRTLKPDRVRWEGSIEALQEKLIGQMTEEAAICVEQGIIKSPDLLDAAVVFGAGFAPFRGGPLQYARSKRK